MTISSSNSSGSVLAQILGSRSTIVTVKRQKPISGSYQDRLVELTETQVMATIDEFIQKAVVALDHCYKGEYDRGFMVEVAGAHVVREEERVYEKDGNGNVVKSARGRWLRRNGYYMFQFRFLLAKNIIAVCACQPDEQVHPEQNGCSTVTIMAWAADNSVRYTPSPRGVWQVQDGKAVKVGDQPISSADELLQDVGA